MITTQDKKQTILTIENNTTHENNIIKEFQDKHRLTSFYENKNEYGTIYQLVSSNSDIHIW